jgi:predicted nucleic acid-binding protein
LLRYLDSSAIVKLVVTEAESEALFEHLTTTPGAAVSSMLSAIEVPRAVARTGIGAQAAARVEVVFAAIDLRRIDDQIVRAAADLEPAGIRTLDAIHIATATEFAAELDEFVAYDRRLLEAAEMRGIKGKSPDDLTGAINP